MHVWISLAECNKFQDAKKSLSCLFTYLLIQCNYDSVKEKRVCKCHFYILEVGYDQWPVVISAGVVTCSLIYILTQPENQGLSYLHMQCYMTLDQ